MKFSKRQALDAAGFAGRIIIGAAVYAAGFRFFLYDYDIIVGGVTGIAMIINRLTNFPIGVMVIIMNIPLFLLAWKKFGMAYMVGSLIGMLVSSVMVDTLELVPFSFTVEPLLACIYGGVVQGVGLGLVYSAGGSSGGSSILARLLRLKYPYINFGTIILLIDVAVVVTFAVIFQKYNNAMYALISMYVVARLIDLVLYGASSSRVFHIISDYSDEVSAAITERLGRGVTLLYGRGAYSGKEKRIILCVIKRGQIVEIRKLVKEIDENAFIIMSESHEVYGQGFGHLDNTN